eukprot:TRINITY_DN5243_c0_g1_i6.p1 TRINITY_DN5243_c0_g1~~TRINITY_DN5243_c0_g1_i6.p1  ORF type:complete len:253 (-),score=14.53 TRINITY_DN5243_c0_g1_i6:17-682(-)
MGYGGYSDPCTLNMNNDRSNGANKDPTRCTDAYFYLWDEPATQGKDASWAAQEWQRYVKRWGSQLRKRRAEGMRVVSPIFHGETVLNKFRTFFNGCRACSDPNSNMYIDILGFNAWLGSWGQIRGQADWIKGNARELKRSYNNRPVFLINFAYLGGQTANDQKKAIIDSGIFDGKSTGIDAVYYFSARDFGGGTRNNELKARLSDGRTIGKLFVSKCNSVR